MRQTDLTAEQIIMRLDEGDTRYPTCFYVNELGELAQEGDTTAESALTAYLEPGTPELKQAPAYAHLKSCTHPLAPTTTEALASFERDNANARIVAWVRNRLAAARVH